MVGSIGPLVQGALPRVRSRLEITALFVAGFLAGATIVFTAASLIGAAAQIGEMPLAWRRCIAAAVLVALAMVDVWARRHATYCPIGLRRQTPRRLRRGRPLGVVASLWGFDTGLAVTTFRVTAATWAAIVLAMLGLSGWQAGIVYGIAFAIPVAILMWTHRAGRLAVTLAPGDLGLAELLNKRPVWQAISASLLLAGAAILVAELLLDVT